MKKIFLLVCYLPLGLFAQSTEETEDLLWNYFNSAVEVAYTDKDSSYYYFEKAEGLAKQLNFIEDQLYILSVAINTSDYHFDLETSAKILKKTDSLLSIENIGSTIENYDAYLHSYLAYQGNYYYKLGAYEKAKKYFLQLQSIYSDTSYDELEETHASALFSNNNFLGVIYKHTGKFELSEQYYLANRSLIEQNRYLKRNSEAYLTNVDQLLAQLYVELQQYKEAATIFEKGLETYKTYYLKNKIFKNNLVNIYQRATDNYIKQDSLNKAINLLNESQSYLLPEDPFYKQALLLYGDIYLKQGLAKKALDSYQSALEILEKYRRYRPHKDIAEVHGKIAELLLKQKDFNEGLKTMKKAFNASGSNIQITDYKFNPDPHNVFSKTQLLHLLDIKLQLLEDGFEENADATYQEAILQTSRDILSTFDLLKSEFDSKLDKQFLADKAYPIFHRLLESAYKVYEKNPSEEILKLALNIAEKNKDFILLEALRNSQATQYGNVPQRVLDKESQFRAEITHIEKQKFDDTETETIFSDKLFSLKQEYYNFLDTIKSNYPKYHELKYQNVALDLAPVREKVLDEDGTLVSYTLTEGYLYVIVLDDLKANFLKLPFGHGDRETIRKFYKVLSNPSIGDSQKAISDLGKELFAKILKKPIEGFATENLIIVPDGELHYLPFDLLQVKGDYLLQSTTIGYGNSVTSLIELKFKKKSKSNHVLAFAPTFEGALATNTDRQFGKLLYNDDEVSKISMFYNTETVLNDQATLENFKAKTTEFNVLHLATHASANDEYPDYSYLAFTQTKDTTQGNILYIKDLYNMSLNTDMVTLSACETGIGKLQKGQGMLSLSKGFYYAGAKSLVNTLWKINDKSTVALMDYFYKGLSEGKTKPEALRDAKLKYLETTDDNLLRHPYYWAAFVVSGNSEPLNNSSKKWWWMMALVPLVISGFWWLKKKSLV